MDNIPAQLLRDRGFDVKFYYLRHGGHPRVTVCLVMKDEAFVARGIAICVYPDQPSKTKGKLIAARRAYSAAVHRKTVYQNVGQAAVHLLIHCSNKTTTEGGVGLYNTAKTPSTKKYVLAMQEYEPIRTPHEKILTKRRKDGKEEKATA